MGSCRSGHDGMCGGTRGKAKTNFWLKNERACYFGMCSVYTDVLGFKTHSGGVKIFRLDIEMRILKRDICTETYA